MENSPVLLVSALALLVASLALLLCAIVLLCHLLKHPKAAEQAERSVVVVQPQARKPMRQLTSRKKDGPLCVQCNRKLPDKPERGLENDEGSFLVYKCKCGQETVLPNNPTDIAL